MHRLPMFAHEQSSDGLTLNPRREAPIRKTLSPDCPMLANAGCSRIVSRNIFVRALTAKSSRWAAILLQLSKLSVRSAVFTAFLALQQDEGAVEHLQLTMNPDGSPTVHTARGMIQRMTRDRMRTVVWQMINSIVQANPWWTPKASRVGYAEPRLVHEEMKGSERERVPPAKSRLVQTRCPLSGREMILPVRGCRCKHAHAFCLHAWLHMTCGMPPDVVSIGGKECDAKVLIDFVRRIDKRQPCPHPGCNESYFPEELQVDTYLARAILRCRGRITGMHGSISTMPSDSVLRRDLTLHMRQYIAILPERLPSLSGPEGLRIRAFPDGAWLNCGRPVSQEDMTVISLQDADCAGLAIPSVRRKKPCEQAILVHRLVHRSRVASSEPVVQIASI